MQKAGAEYRQRDSDGKLHLRGSRLALLPGFLGPASLRSIGLLGWRRGRRRCLLQPGPGEDSCLLEDRIGDGTDVRINALQVADQIEVQRGGLDALQGVDGEAL